MFVDDVAGTIFSTLMNELRKQLPHQRNRKKFFAAVITKLLQLLIEIRSQLLSGGLECGDATHEGVDLFLTDVLMDAEHLGSYRNAVDIKEKEEEEEEEGGSGFDSGSDSGSDSNEDNSDADTVRCFVVLDLLILLAVEGIPRPCLVCCKARICVSNRSDRPFGGRPSLTFNLVAWRCNTKGRWWQWQRRREQCQ
jgi:hypothetical protein